MRLILVVFGFIWIAIVGTAGATLTHQYTFNDGTANDSVGAANGTLMGGATVSGGQVHMNGTSGTYVNLPGPTIAINTYTDATFEGWFTYNNSSSFWQRLFDFGATPAGSFGQDYIFYTPNSSSLTNRAALSTVSGIPNLSEDRAEGASPLSTGTQHYVAVAVDGTQNGGSGKMALYVDGVLTPPPAPPESPTMTFGEPSMSWPIPPQC